jgi:hypothetical protein
VPWLAAPFATVPMREEEVSEEGSEESDPTDGIEQ